VYFYIVRIAVETDHHEGDETGAAPANQKK
jgi:hypothetical protein